MAVFAVLADKPNSDLKERINTLYPADNFEVDDRTWLISNETVANALGDQLGVRDGSYGRVLVMRVTEIAGWHNRSLWPWAEQKFG